MSQFTPGPWNYDEGDFSIYAVETFEPIEFTEANAALIASAPALYEALKTLVSRYGYEDDNITPKDWSEWVEARAALAAAEGNT